MLRPLRIAKILVNHQILRNTVRKISTSNIKHSGAPRWSYRRPAYPAPLHLERLADVVGTLMWYWILYHCITQYEHITGEWPYPDASKWTDAELGIPPEDS